MPIAKNTRRATRTPHSATRSSRRGRNADKRGTGRRNAARSGGSEPNHLKYSKWIESPDDHEDRNGQSLATRNHDVIRKWARARKAVPSTVGDTEGGDEAGVLRIDFPGYGGKRLKKIDWDAWFDTFDKRKLVFLFQEHKKDGSTSTFFKLAA